MKTKIFKSAMTFLIVLFLTSINSIQAQKNPNPAVSGETVKSEKKQEKIVHDLLKAFNIGSGEVLKFFREEAIIEYPYAHSLGTPSSLNKIQYGNYIKGALENMPDIEFSNISIYTSRKNTFWAEFHGETTIPSTNQRYKQDYVVRITLKNGKIIRYKEYWNPMAVSAMGDEKEVNKMFNDKSKQ